MNSGQQDAGEPGRREGERLSDHVCEVPHHLIGATCLYDQGSEKVLAIPYGACRVKKGEGSRKGEPRLAVAYFTEANLHERDDLPEPAQLEIRALSAVHPEDLTPVKISSELALGLYNAVIRWLANKNPRAI